jgi:class 3 adenylate cyclase/TolB-like protein
MNRTGLDQPGTKRSLAAIMFTDIVGFTALMGASEERALRTRRINREIHQQRIEAAGGTWLKEMGDGTMASFASITDALRAAIEIRQICKREMGIEIKVGIHFGEVTNEDNDVFGDGVNMAARIEALAAGGGILISESVYKDIKNKPDFRTAFIGEATLKNVPGRHKIYQVLDGDLVKPTVRIKTSSKSGILAGIAALIVVMATVSYLVIWPRLLNKIDTSTSIAVLPFHSQSNDESQKHYGVGLASEIRSKLSQSKQFEFISSMQATMAYGYADSPAKIGDELDVKYILSGLYQIVGERIKVDVELVDARSGGVVWNITFNELFTDIFALQSKIAARVFSEFSMTGSQPESAPTQNMEAYAHYLKGVASIASPKQTSTSGRNLEAEEHLSLAIQKDSSFIEPFVSLIKIKAYWIFLHARMRDGEEYTSLLKEIAALEDYSMKHFSGSPKYTLIQALITYLVDRDFDEALKLFEEVLAHDPENFHAHLWLGGGIYKRKLMQKEALAHLSKATKIDPSFSSAWSEITIVFATMGDYISAEKAYHHATILGANSNADAGIFFVQGKTRPGLKEEDPIRYFVDTKMAERDFRGIIAMLDTAAINTLTIAVVKAQSYYGLGIQDSVKHYGQLYLDSTDGFNPFIHALLGNKEVALRNLQESVKEVKDSDLMRTCGSKVQKIELLSILGEYEEATELLVTMNRQYPTFGAYARLFSSPMLDRIKSEHPPFVEALNNLKLPPKLELEGLIKF